MSQTSIIYPTKILNPVNAIQNVKMISPVLLKFTVKI